MQFLSFTLSALLASSALAQDMIKTHVVRVGSLTGDLTFMPSTLTAAAGDMVQFQFAPKNHTVTQSTFDQPCAPASLNSNITGIYSGFMPVAADASMTATWTVRVNDTKPIWLYCSQGKHCQGGMVMVINPPAANASRTFETYKALSAQASVNLPGGSGAVGGTPANGTNPGTIGDVVSTNPTNPTATAGSGSGSDSGSGSGSSPSSTSSPTPSPLVNDNSAMGLSVSGAAGFGGALAVAFALFL